MGNHSRDTVPMARISLNKQAVLKNVANVIAPKEELEFFDQPERPAENVKGLPVNELKVEDLRVHNGAVKKLDTIRTYVQEGSGYSSYVNKSRFDIPFRCKEEIEYVKPISSHSFVDVAAGRVSLEDFVGWATTQGTLCQWPASA